jgi:PTH1 family peptidyl-tRNA hydrolase
VKLLVGLGNPGFKYRYTRHNIGYRVITKLAEELKVKFKRSYLLRSLISQTKLGVDIVILALPLTFMNTSGNAVGKIVKRKEIKSEDILVVCDDIDTDFGKIKIRPSGSNGGHQGLRSIIETLGNSDFARLKIGIGRPMRKEDVADYVLSNFSKDEESSLTEVITRAVACCYAWLKDGIVIAMNKFN